MRDALAVARKLVDRAADAFLLWLADFMVAPARRPRQKLGALARLSDWMLDNAGGNGAYSAGLHLVEMGRPDAAEVAFGDAERWYERHLGSTHPHVGLAAEYRAWCCAKLGRYSEAVPLYEKALAIAAVSSGPDSEMYASIGDNLEIVRSRLS
jgi:tetratricopeptide (TPR) repeat protein